VERDRKIAGLTHVGKSSLDRMIGTSVFLARREIEGPVGKGNPRLG
jgi:hypothetical protein